MTTWKDSQGRSWSIDLTLELADQILEVTQVDLLPDDNNYSEYLALCIRPRKLSAVLWECSRKAAESLKVSQESFSEGLNSEALATGWKAIWEAIENFSKGQPVLAQMVKETMNAQMRGIEAGVTAMIDTLKSESMEAAITEAVAEIDAELRRNLKTEMQRGMQEARARSATS